MNYKTFNLDDWIAHINEAIEDERELDGNEMRDLVAFLKEMIEWLEDYKRLKTEYETVRAMRAEITKLQTYKMFPYEDTVYVERDEVMKIFEKYTEGESKDADSD